MNRIIAKGQYRGMTYDVAVELEGGELIVEVGGEVDSVAHTRLVKLIADQPPMGGTYYPPQNSLLATFNVLTNTFFDDLIEIKVEGDIGEIPNVEGVIY